MAGFYGDEDTMIMLDGLQSVVSSTDKRAGAVDPF